MEVIHIGREFYRESGTMMSSVYKINPDGGFDRTDWGFIEIALEEGKSVHIRPATKMEMDYFEAVLHTMKMKGGL